MLKFIRIFTVISLFLINSAFCADGSVLRNFRSYSDILQKKNLNQMGVEEHFLSGSGQFSAESLKYLSPKIEIAVEEIVVIDLRLESHGFANGLPVSWKNSENVGKTCEQILVDEAILLQETFAIQQIDVFPVHSIATEKEIVEGLGFKYIRLPILDHSHPTDEQVDEFLHLFRMYPNSWLHAHCAVGRGRTTLFMAMFDMFHNAKEVSFEDILKRQKEIGGQDFQKYLNEPNKDPKKQELFLNRLGFLEKFYQFCQNENLQTASWLKSQSATTTE
jgi:protein-tyrosine phosphatase